MGFVKEVGKFALLYLRLLENKELNKKKLILNKRQGYRVLAFILLIFVKMTIKWVVKACGVDDTTKLCINRPIAQSDSWVGCL